ncbi:ATP-binding cassette subfamily B protein [Stackebrandtia endophytica]|uniref:ATP-binding cassette subfamily B protein n=1 Tax=Stackebrandtia endophytica TaxID=1496996 RepID=A0A543B118_9ACTN|nr:ABC transporter ATP-binding protein [Stackebrandtia endophytica]TQL78523.1 ATP-binding cassette subfamily B protein [Stackebrandtia endophytica]
MSASLRSLLRLCAFTLRSGPFIAYLIAFAVLTALLGTGLTILIGRVVAGVADVSIGSVPESLWWPVGLLCLTILFRNLLPIALDLARRRCIYDLEPVVHRSIHDALMSEPGIGHLESAAVQDGVDRARGIGGFGVRAFVDALGSLIIARLSAVSSALVVGIWFSWPVAVVVLATTWFVEWYSAAQLRAESDQWADQTEEQRKAAYVFELGMGRAAKEIRIFGLGPWFVDRYLTSWHNAMRPLWQERRRAALRTFAVYGVHLAVLIGAVIMVGWTDELPVAEVTTVVVALLGLGAAADGHSASRMRRGIEAFRAIEELPRLVETARSTITPEAARVEGVVRFENVWFRYGDESDWVLRGVDLELVPNGSTALVGVNGAGKSTIVKLMTGVYSPSRGRILVDGAEATKPDPMAWQRRIAAVAQDFVRLPVTLAQNVTMAEDAPDTRLLTEVAALTGLDVIVAASPRGWETVLDRSMPGGMELSGGQWQRVALARAAYAARIGADLLILDEPASALDVRGEADLIERYLDLTAGHTSFVISHRFSVVRGADRICVLDDGAIVETGTHEQLLDRRGRYAAMFATQAKRYTMDGGSRD